MTSSVCPASSSFRNAVSSFAMSSKCRPGRRLVEDVQQPLAAVRRQVRRDLDPLRLAARQRRRRLSETEVAEADLVEHLQPPQHLRRAAEEGQRLAHGEVEHLMDRSAAVAHLEHLRLEALAVALIAGHEDVGEKLHLDAHFAFALARFAAAARHVEGEVARRQAARSRVLGRGEQLADRIERLEVGDRIRARRPADRRLIDQHHVGDELGAFERAGTCRRACPSRPSRA